MPESSLAFLSSVLVNVFSIFIETDKERGGGHGQVFLNLIVSPFEKDLEMLHLSSLPFPSAILYAYLRKKKEAGEGDNGLKGRITTVSLQKI